MIDRNKYRPSGGAPPAAPTGQKGMFDQSIMDESNMDASNMSIDLGNLSTIFGGSGNKAQKANVPEPIKEMDEEEEDGRKGSMFA